jgi:hypothetical protein
MKHTFRIGYEALTWIGLVGLGLSRELHGQPGLCYEAFYPRRAAAERSGQSGSYPNISVREAEP